MRKFFINIKNQILRFIAWVRNKFHTPNKYRVTKCPHMPSLVGMITTNKLEKNKELVFLGAKKQYRIIKPIKIVKKDKEIEVFTDYLFFTLTAID